MILAMEQDPVREVLDQPWRIGGQLVPWLSSQIAVMILAGAILATLLPLMTRLHIGRRRPGPCYLTEAMLLFVRRYIAVPALGSRARAFLPFLATLLCFLLAVNLLGLLPLRAVSQLLRLRDTPVGGTPTSSIWVCGALAAMVFLTVMLTGYFGSVRRLWRGGAEGHAPAPPAGANLFLALSRTLQHRRWSLPVAAVAAVPVWLNSFVPEVPGAAGLVAWPGLLVLELIGYVAKCFALCIRLFVNMVGGHLLLAVVIVLAAGGRGWALAYASLPGAGGAVLVMILEAVVGILQAYVFTMLAAVYIGLATNPEH